MSDEAGVEERQRVSDGRSSSRDTLVEHKRIMSS